MEDIAILFLAVAALSLLVYKMYKTATSAKYIEECVNTREKWKNHKEIFPELPERASRWKKEKAK